VAIRDIVHGLGQNAVHVLTVLLSTTVRISVFSVNRIVCMKNSKTSVNAVKGFMDNAVNIVRFIFINKININFSLMPYGHINLFSTVCLYLSLKWKKYFCAGVYMTPTLFCTPAYFNDHHITFVLKLGTYVVNMTTSWRYWFPRYNVFDCFSLKETENLMNLWCKIKICFTRDRKSCFHEWCSHAWKYGFYHHEWNKFLSNTNILQISSMF